MYASPLCKGKRKSSSRRKRMRTRTRKHNPESQRRGIAGERIAFDSALEFAFANRATTPLVLERVAQEPYRGDLVWKEGNMHVHIEVKNVRGVSDRTLTRFDHNIRRDRSVYAIDAAMFVNVDDAPIEDVLDGPDWLVWTEYQACARTNETFPVVWVRGIGDAPQRFHVAMESVRSWYRNHHEIS